MDFAKMVVQQLKSTDTSDNSNSNNNRPERKHEIIPLNGKHPAYVRVVPLGTDKWFAWGFQQIFVQLHKEDGTAYTMPIRFPENPDKDDKLFKLIRNVIRFNNQYRHDNPEFKNDIIKISAGRFGASLSKRYAIQAIKLDPKTNLMENVNGYPTIREMDISTSAMHNLLDQVNSGIKLAKVVDGKLAHVDFPTPLGFIDAGEAYGVEMKLSSTGTSYDVKVRSDLDPLPALPEDYLERTSDNTDYVHMDDPKKYNDLIIDNEDLYNRAYEELAQRVEEQKNTLDQQESLASNPYNAPSASTPVTQPDPAPKAKTQNQAPTSQANDEISIPDEDPLAGLEAIQPSTPETPKAPAHAPKETEQPKADTSVDSDDDMGDVDDILNNFDINNLV